MNVLFGYWAGRLEDVNHGLARVGQGFSHVLSDERGTEMKISHLRVSVGKPSVGVKNPSSPTREIHHIVYSCQH